MHEYFMGLALEEANAAFIKGEVPIGAVIIKDGNVIGRGHNLRNTNKNPLHHGEILAINEAASVIGDWRLEDCIIYVTVEPCPMCAGAIVLSRIPQVVFGTRNPKAGCCGSILNLMNEPRLNHQVEILEGVLADSCAELMKRFFSELRKVTQ